MITLVAKDTDLYVNNGQLTLKRQLNFKKVRLKLQRLARPHHDLDVPLCFLDAMFRFSVTLEDPFTTHRSINLQKEVPTQELTIHGSVHWPSTEVVLYL